MKAVFIRNRMKNTNEAAIVIQSGTGSRFFKCSDLCYKVLLFKSETMLIKLEQQDLFSKFLVYENHCWRLCPIVCHNSNS